nr:VWA domain-containing protein [Candidatus Sigynarchaeum springense]
MASRNDPGMFPAKTPDQLPDERQGTLARWRLILGKKAEEQGISGVGAGFAGLFGKGAGGGGNGDAGAGGETGEGTGSGYGQEGEEEMLDELLAEAMEDLEGEGAGDEGTIPETGEPGTGDQPGTSASGQNPPGGQQPGPAPGMDQSSKGKGHGSRADRKGRASTRAGGTPGAGKPGGKPGGAPGAMPGAGEGVGAGGSAAGAIPGQGMGKPGGRPTPGGGARHGGVAGKPGGKPGHGSQGGQAGRRGAPGTRAPGNTEGKPGQAGQPRPGRAPGGPGQAGKARAMQRFNDLDNTLEFVYNPDKTRGAGLSSSGLSIPKWLENVKELFPGQAKEVLEKDLIKKSNIADLIRNPELFEKVEPSIDMVKTIISLKHMLPADVKAVARKVVARVVEDLKDKLKTEVERHIIGAIKRDVHTPVKIFRNIDWRQSIRRNMKNYDPPKRRIIMAEPRFFSNEKRKKPWQIIVLIDESGSMADSVIYSVVMASIFATLPALHTNLCIFDTRVVDLSDKVQDPVDILMSVQLGGGTDITGAVRYGRSLIKNPKKCIMVVISDFYEGRPAPDLIREFKLVLEGESKVLGLAALGSNARPVYNVPFAKQLKEIGIDVIASTPENLAEIIGRLMSK